MMNGSSVEWSALGSGTWDLSLEPLDFSQLATANGCYFAQIAYTTVVTESRTSYIPYPVIYRVQDSYQSVKSVVAGRMHLSSLQYFINFSYFVPTLSMSGIISLFLVSFCFFRYIHHTPSTQCPPIQSDQIKR